MGESKDYISGKNEHPKPEPLPKLESRVVELSHGTFKEFYAQGEPERIVTWQEKEVKEIYGSLVHEISNLPESLKRLPALFKKINECYKLNIPLTGNEISDLINKSFKKALDYPCTGLHTHNIGYVAINETSVPFLIHHTDYIDYLQTSGRQPRTLSEMLHSRHDRHKALVLDPSFMQSELIDHIYKLELLQVQARNAQDIEARRDFLEQIDRLKSIAMEPLVKIYQELSSRGVNVQFHADSEDILLAEFNMLRLGKAPSDTSAGAGVPQETAEQKNANQTSKTAGLEQTAVQVTRGEKSLKKEFEDLISTVFGPNIRHCPLTGGEFYLKKPGKMATILEKLAFPRSAELAILPAHGGFESPYRNILADIFDGGQYHPIQIKVYSSDLMHAAEEFAKEYERISGQKAKIVQEYHTTDKPKGLESQLAEPTTAEQKTPFQHPEAMTELPKDEWKLYKSGEMQLYLSKNKETGKATGTLRCELNSPKATETLLTLMKHLSLRSSSKLPTSIDELSTMLAAATKDKQDIDLDRSRIGNKVVFEYADKVGYAQSNYTDREFGHIGMYITPAAIGLIASVLGLGVSSFAGLAAGTASLISAGGLFASLFGSMGLYSWHRHKFCKSLLDPEKVLGVIQEENAELSKMVDKKNKPFLITNLQKHGEQITQHNRKLSELEFVLQTAIQKNCASITYSGESQEEVLDFFNSLCTGKNKPKTINAEVMPAETKQTTETPEPVLTMDEIIIEQRWTKDDQYGKEIDGRYALKEKIGEGGLCRVYRAIRILDDKEVAIKFEKPETRVLRQKEELIKTLKSIRHENLLETYDANLTAAPAYIVMDLINGADLEEIICETHCNGKSMSIGNILSVANQAGNAIKALHANKTHKKITHNDIKPQNILVDENGKVYLGDCDVADVTKDICSILSGMTAQKASGAGTLDYMAPERRGTVRIPVSEKSDIYSFGVVLYHMLAGRVPMAPNGLDHRTDLPKELRRILCKCVEPSPAERYYTMTEVLDDLNKLPIESKPIKLTIRKSTESKEALIKEQPKQNSPDADLIEKIQEGLSSGRLSVEGAMDAANLTMEDVLSANPEKLDEQSQNAILAASEQALINDKEPDKNELFNSAELPSAAELKEEEELEPLISPDDLDDDEPKKQLE